MRDVFHNALFVRPFSILFLIVCLADVTLVLIYGFVGLEAYRNGTHVASLWQISADQSVASYWNYAKLLVSVFALLLAAYMQKEFAYALFAVAVAVLLVDDFFELHDRVAWSVGGYFEESVIGEVHQQSRGEPIVFAVFGLFVLAIMGLAYRRTRPENLVFSQAIVATLLLFAFFASFVDVIHGFSELIVVSGQQAVSGLFNMLEEGGELFALSSLVFLCLWLSIGNARSLE